MSASHHHLCHSPPPSLQKCQQPELSEALLEEVAGRSPWHPWQSLNLFTVLNLTYAPEQNMYATLTISPAVL